MKSNFQNQGKTQEGEILNVSDTYIRSNRLLFEIDEGPEGPFSHCTRSLLVDSILNNLEIKYFYQNRKRTIKGLPLLINSKYFDESFVLHDQTSHEYFTKIMNNFKWDHKEYGKSSIDYLRNILKQYSMTSRYDARSFLQNNWASLKNLFKFQPLSKIRDYFGEQNAIYFGFVGSFITMLWLPSLVGVTFFLCGIYFFYSYV